jgi:hypothetical protein
MSGRSPHGGWWMSSLLLLMSCGGGSSNSGGGGPVVPPVPSGVTATAGNTQVVLSWGPSSGATNYHVKRATISGGPYTQVAAPTTTSDTDTGLTNGTAYYYVVSAVNSAGESANSAQVAATPIGPQTNVHVSVDVLTNRHSIGPYVYGGAFPKDVATITDSGLPVVRWGGNAASTYNWQLWTNNADNDYYFEDFAFSALSNSSDSDSVKFIQDVKTAGSAPLMTMVMLPWVAKSAEDGVNGHWSYSVAKYQPQCKVDPFNSDAGNGQKSDCKTYFAADPNDAYFPLLDQPGIGDPPGSVYRNQWTAALATAFGSAPHFYNMDNEIDIWGGTHIDIHPAPTTYQELRDIYLSEARALKGWDPAAIRLGPVSCCWYFYWRSATGDGDTSSHGGVDFLPWWLNEVAWSDAIAGSRSLDIFDIHAYPDGPDTSQFTTAQKQALAVRIYRDWWDPTYTSEATYIQNGGFSIEPMDSKPFRIPRMRAILNSIYRDTKFSVTEWSAAFAGEADFSTVLGDADAYGILGRERAYLATRWEAPLPTNPNYQALKLFTNYDGQHHSFAPISVSATNDGDPNLFSSYAAVNAGGTTMTLLFLNKDPQNTAQTQFAFNGFTPTQVTTYTLSQSAPNAIVASSPMAWTSSISFAPYTATLLVITGTTANVPAAEWDLNPDTTMVPANGTVTLSPKIVSGSGQVTLGAPQFDNGITVAVTQGTITTGQNGAITVTAGGTPGFYHYSVPGTDSNAIQNQGGWIVVGKPAATFPTKTGDGQSGPKGTTLPNPLSVTLSAGGSGGTNTGASVLFTTDGGSLSNGTTTGAKVIAITNNSGVASVTLTLPNTAGTVHVTAEGPYGLGHPTAAFTETAN